ncbi:unnamed protein product [Heligmosomoides polygyrus]|uniref:CCHC-type domain-containing protein n=1 Tax=Heligmosomoides polygyrus TaxID=6339 RepID=A0A183FVS7_HELPZ|nr:unnamed protein product [Heligmosomoides polygyrus]
MSDEELKKYFPVSDDEEQEDLLDLGDFDGEEEKEDSPTDEPEGQESEEGDETDKPPVDEPEETEEKEEQEKGEARPLTRNDLVSFGVRTLKLVQNIGTRQQVLLESLKEQTEDRLNRIEKKLTPYQIRTEYMLSVLMYGEEDETESVTDQPTTSRRAPTAGEPLPKKKREAFEVRVAASQLNSLVECPERRVGHAPYALYRDGVLVRCRFCRAEGTHATDSCPVYSQTEDRRTLVERRGYCLKCLGRCPREECRQPESCYYCGGKSHNTALCTLPEERKHYEEVLMRAPARH